MLKNVLSCHDYAQFMYIHKQKPVSNQNAVGSFLPYPSNKLHGSPFSSVLHSVLTNKWTQMKT